MSTISSVTAKNESDLSYLNTQKFKDEIDRLKTKYPDRVPIIVVIPSNCPFKLPKRKFLSPGNLSIVEFLVVIRSHLKVNSDQGIYLYFSNKLLPSSMLLSEVYKQYKDPSGFLIAHLELESTFGASLIQY